MKYTVISGPVQGLPRSIRGHDQWPCVNGHEECASRPGGLCVQDVASLCSRCRSVLVGSEVRFGSCGDCGGRALTVVS